MFTRYANAAMFVVPARLTIWIIPYGDIANTAIFVVPAPLTSEIIPYIAFAIVKGVDLQDGLEDVDVQVEILDLGSLQSVVSFAQRFKASGSKADVLINNAGIMAIPERRETVDGLEMQIGVNHFGGHLLTRLMEPMIADGGRILFLSSLVHEQPPRAAKTTWDWNNINFEKPNSYDPWQAYGRSKLANILDAKAFATRLSVRGITTYAIHPGVVHTELMREMTDSSFLSRVSRWTAPIHKFLLDAPLKGSLTTLRCAVDPSVGGLELSGKYWADMKVERPSELASDPANPSRLWDYTEDMLEAKLGGKVDELLA